LPDPKLLRTMDSIEPDYRRAEAGKDLFR